MKGLEQILRGVEISEIIGIQQRKVQDIHIDSRMVNENSLFLAVPGIQADGHDFIKAAIENGSSVIVCERLPENLDNRVTYVVLKDIRKMQSVIVSNFLNILIKE